MKWLWGKKRLPPACQPADAKGAEAHRKATEHLNEATAQWPEVRRVSKSLRELRERNHFRDQIELIFQGGERRER